MRTLWNDCEPSKGFVRSGRSVRQYDLLLRCSSARLVWGFRVSAFAFFYSGGALLDSRVRNHARVQDRSSFGNSPFKSKFCCLGFGTSLLFGKNLSHPFLSDRILYHSCFSSTPASSLFLISHLAYLPFLSSFLYSSPFFPLFLSCFPWSAVPKFGNIRYKNYTE